MASIDVEQIELLAALVEASRTLPRNRREPIRMIATAGSINYVMLHPGIPQNHAGAYPADVEILHRAGFIYARHEGQHSLSVDVTPQGYDFYARQRQSAADRVQEVERQIRSFLDGDVLRQIYPEAIKKWNDAENLLWAADGQAQLTAIGHHLREALQSFASTLVARHPTANAPTDPTKTIARVRAVLDAKIGSTTAREFQSALLAYWGTLNDLIQRQEHGALREGDALTWSDARRAVFQTLVVMHELHSALA